MLLDRVAGIISRYNMWPPGARVGVAVSGGADSVCLLRVLVELSPQWNLKLGVLHLNHSTRGPESDADEAFVRDLAVRYDLPFHAERRQFGADNGNFEQAARDARLAFFHDLIASRAYDRVATGHTASDQAETVLYRLLRGAFTTGLSGIRPATSEGIVRPLLFEPRAEIEAFLRGRGLEWREDRTNADLAFDRNRLRHKLIPQLEADWNPRIADTLARQAELALADEDYWAAEADRNANLALTLDRDAVIADTRALSGMHLAVRRRVIRHALNLVRGDLRQIGFAHIDSILALSAPPDEGHARVQVPGVDVIRSFEWLRFAPLPSRPREDFDLPVTIPGRIRLPPQACEIRFEVVAKSADATIGRGLSEAVLASLAAELRVRNWRPGDRYQPAGRQGEHKIKELFQEYRVPLWERRSWPVLVAGGRILWVRRFGPAADCASQEAAAAVQIREAMLESDEAAPASV